MFNLNFFKKLEEETHEQVCMKQRLGLVMKMQEETMEKDSKNQKSNKKKWQASNSKPK